MVDPSNGVESVAQLEERIRRLAKQIETLPPEFRSGYEKQLDDALKKSAEELQGLLVRTEALDKENNRLRGLSNLMLLGMLFGAAGSFYLNAPLWLTGALFLVVGVLATIGISLKFKLELELKNVESEIAAKLAIHERYARSTG